MSHGSDSEKIVAASNGNPAPLEKTDTQGPHDGRSADELATEHEQERSALQRAIETAEGMLATDPANAEAAQGLWVTLEKLSASTAKTPGKESLDEALRLQMKAMVIAAQFYQQNFEVHSVARAAGVSAYLAYHRAVNAGQAELAQRNLVLCYEILHDAVSRGIAFDPPIQNLYQHLASIEKKVP